MIKGERESKTNGCDLPPQLYKKWEMCLGTLLSLSLSGCMIYWISEFPFILSEISFYSHLGAHEIAIAAFYVILRASLLVIHGS